MFNTKNIKITIAKREELKYADGCICFKPTVGERPNNICLDSKDNCCFFDDYYKDGYEDYLCESDDVIFMYSKILPKLKISDSLKKYLIENRKTGVYKDGLIQVEFGSYCDESINQKDKLYKKAPKMKKTGQYLSYPSYNYDLLEVAESKDNKYGFYYDCFNQLYVYKINPLKWYLKPNTNEMILGKTIEGELVIGYGSLNNESKKMPSNKVAFMKEFLEERFLHDIFKFENVNNKGFVDLQQEKELISKKIQDLNNMFISKPNSKLYVNKLTNIIQEYNKGLSAYHQSLNQVLNFGIKDETQLTTEFIFNLNELEEEANYYYESIKEYIDMIDYLDVIEGILSGNEYKKMDEFQSLVFEVNTIPLEYLKSDEIRNNVKNELCYKPRAIINNYLFELQQNKGLKLQEFNSKKELITYLRKQLQTLLEDILVKVNKKSYIDDIKENMLKIQNDNYKQSKYRIIDIYLGMIKDAYYDIKYVFDYNPNLLNQANEIISKEIDYDQDLNDICTELTNRYYSLRDMYYAESEKRAVSNIKQKRISLEKVMKTSY